jgi:surfeit locus 1 family protein
MAEGRRQFALQLLGWRFAPRLLPSLAVALLLPLLLGLGTWQLDRAAFKRALLDTYAVRGADRPVNSLPRALDPEAWRFRRVALGGRFDDAHALLLDNRTYRGMAGYHLLTPLRLDDGRGVLVNRGWAPRGRTRDDLPPIAHRAGRVTVAGQLDTPPASGLSVGPDGPEASGWPRVVQRLDLDALARELGYPLLPLLLLEGAGGEAELVRDWRPVVMGPARHTGYAVQWFALALALLVIYVVVNTRRVQGDE